jgi:hypothetical protein
MLNLHLSACSDTSSVVNMNQVNIFDVASVSSPNSGSSSNGWYTQTITGTVPDPRVDFCLVLASAPDNSSFNIYMYGGTTKLTLHLSAIADTSKQVGIPHRATSILTKSGS